MNKEELGLNELLALGGVDEVTYHNIKHEVGGFYLTNNGAHQIDHAQDVVLLALRMNHHLGLNLPVMEIILAGFYHDITCDVRKTHHLTAGDYIMAHAQWFAYTYDLTIDQVINIAFAIKQHRASYTGEFNGPLSELISSADRGTPDVTRFIKRLALVGSGFDVAVVHLKDKSGTKGYARYPAYYTEYFGEETLTNFKQAVDDISIDNIFEIYASVN